MRGLQEYFEGRFVILDTEKIVEIEEGVKKEIWIVTYDLSYDMGPFLKAITHNVERGIIYRYFLPTDLEDEFDELKCKVQESLADKNKIEKLESVYVERWKIPLNIVLYDPQTERHGYIYVPEEKTHFFIKFNEKSFAQVRKYFRALTKKVANNRGKS